VNSITFDILIAPVGHQPMPVLLPILEYRPAHTFLIPTPQVKDAEAEAVRRVAKQAGLRVTLLESVDPYKAEQTMDRCREAYDFSHVTGKSVAINISGGTTLMAMGAQQAACDLGLPMIYVNTDDSQIIHLDPDRAEVGREDVTATVTITQYAAAHEATVGVDAIWGTSWLLDADSWGARRGHLDHFQLAARALGAAGSESTKLLDTIRLSLREQGALRGVFAPSDSAATTIDLIDTLYAQGLIDRLADGGIYRVSAQHEYAEGFLKGHWLEFYVADACARSGRFDDVRCGVSLRRKDDRHKVDNDFDVVVSSRGRVAAISCKTGRIVYKPENKDERLQAREMAFELSSLLQADLMGLYARKVLVTNQPGIHKLLSDHAYYGQICCVSGMRLKDVAKIVYDHLKEPQLGIE